MLMSAHVVFPALDANRPATLSRRILGDLLRLELGFDGVLVSDALEMKAIADAYGEAAGARIALAAGADQVIVAVPDLTVTLACRDAVLDALHSRVLPEERIWEAAGRVRRLAERYATPRRTVAPGTRAPASKRPAAPCAPGPCPRRCAAPTSSTCSRPRTPPSTGAARTSSPNSAHSTPRPRVRHSTLSRRTAPPSSTGSYGRAPRWSSPPPTPDCTPGRPGCATRWRPGDPMPCCSTPGCRRAAPSAPTGGEGQPAGRRGGVGGRVTAGRRPVAEGDAEAERRNGILPRSGLAPRPAGPCSGRMYRQR